MVKMVMLMMITNWTMYNLVHRVLYSVLYCIDIANGEESDDEAKEVLVFMLVG